jgi:[protein-PII] uridylyltransferase
MGFTNLNYQFQLDFRRVTNIPPDPRDRLSYFQTFRALLKEEREKIKTWHRSGVGGREIVQAHTGLMDESIRHMVHTLTKLEIYADSNLIENFSLVAVGGYGRGELNPFSDIDLLFVIEKEKDNDIVGSFIQDLISIFWGIGLEIGHSVRTIKNCVSLAKEDLTVQTALVDIRIITGNSGLFDQLNQAIQKNVLKKNIKKILTSKLNEHFDPNQSVSELVCKPEPDIKNGPGGLRYYHTALWGMATLFGTVSFLDFDDGKTISKREIKSYYRSIDFFLRVRNELHYMTEKKTDVLQLDLQKNLAMHLGYRQEEETDITQRLMRDYFLHATSIYNYSEIIFKRCLQLEKPYISKVITSLTQKDLGNGFISKDSELHYKDDIEESFSTNPQLLLTIFEICIDKSLELSPQLKRQIRLNLKLYDNEFVRSAPIREMLFKTFNRSNSEKILRQMHEVGVLGKILPHFEETHCLVRYDNYRRYTADEHSLRMIRFLEELESPEGTELAELSSIFKKTDSKDILKLVALAHSLATVSEGESGDTQKKATALSDQLNLNQEQKEILTFLLNHFFVMTEFAFYKDFHDEKAIKDFLTITQTPEKLNTLYLVSYADLKASAPDTWTSWKRYLLSELFNLTRNRFQKQSEPSQTSALMAKFNLHSILQKEFFAWEIEDHLDRMGEDYLVWASPEAAAEHIRLLKSAKNESFVLDIKYNKQGEHHILTLACEGAKKPLKNLVGILTAKNMTILGAQSFLAEDGIAITILQVGRTDGTIHEIDPIWLEVEQAMQDIIEGKTSIKEVLKERKRLSTYEQKKKTVIMPKVKLENIGNPNYTVIRTEARDHIGMLYKIVAVLENFGIQIHRAKISCNGDRGIDVFHVSLRGKKLSFKRLISRVKNQLISALLLEKVENMIL